MFEIAEQSLEYQVRYYKRRAEIAEAERDFERRRKAPENLVELETALHKADGTIRILRADAEKWKAIGEQFAQRSWELEHEGAADVLRRERDEWRRRWRHATARIGVLLERGADAEASYRTGYAREGAALEDE